LFTQKRNIVDFFVFYIGPAENAAKFKYKVEFANKDNTEGVTLMCLTRSANENYLDMWRSDNCGKLHYDVLRHLRNRKGHLNYKVEIIRVGSDF
jgi:hypothetical protein